MADQLTRRSTLVKPEPITISELQVNTEIRGWLLAEEVQVRTARNGRAFRQLRLRDQRGNEIKARQFDLPPITASLISLRQISLRPGGKLIALIMAAKRRFLPTGLWSRSNWN